MVVSQYPSEHGGDIKTEDKRRTANGMKITLTDKYL